MKFSIIANPGKFEVKDVLRKTISWAERNRVELLISKNLFEEIQLEKPGPISFAASDEEAIHSSDYVIVIGGDGTILYTARISTKMDKPILGINSGRLGFMTNTQADDLEVALNLVLEKNYTLDERHFLKATLKDGRIFYALNEFLFTRKDSTSMVNISAIYGESLINTYWADGLIVSSSTGSTAYSLSSGGPIVVPGAGVLLITPVNPHTLTTRPLVLNADTPLIIKVEKQASEILFSYDGVVCEIEGLPFEVEVTKSDLAFNLIQLPGQDYFETLRKKLMWGQDSRKTKDQSQKT